LHIHGRLVDPDLFGQVAAARPPVREAFGMGGAGLAIPDGM
jgi:hypothetical protein